MIKVLSGRRSLHVLGVTVGAFLALTGTLGALMPAPASAEYTQVRLKVINAWGTPISSAQIVWEDPSCKSPSPPPDPSNPGAPQECKWVTYSVDRDSGEAEVPLEPGMSIEVELPWLPGSGLGSTHYAPTPLPSVWTLTIPNPGLIPHAPELSARERGLIGLINQERARHGLAPLYISTTLSFAADGYSSLVLDPSKFATAYEAHHALGAPDSRANYAGFPSLYVGENIARTGTATTAYELWMNSEVHRWNLLHTQYNSVGIGNQGNTWVLKLARIDAPYPAKAGMTNDIGDPALADLPSHTEGNDRQGGRRGKGGKGDSASNRPRRPRLKLTRLRSKKAGEGRRVRVRLTAARSLIGRKARLQLRIVSSPAGSRQGKQWSIRLKRKQSLRVPTPPRGGRVLLRVIVPSFKAGTDRYRKATASIIIR